jgi:hypothetical protein
MSNTCFFDVRDDLEIGQADFDDRAEVEYHEALVAAEAAGEPWFSFDAFMARVDAANRAAARPPEPIDFDNLPF